VKYLETLREVNKNVIKMVDLESDSDAGNRNEIEHLKMTVNNLQETIKRYQSQSLQLQERPRMLDKEIEKYEGESIREPAIFNDLFIFSPCNDLCGRSDSESQDDLDTAFLEQEISVRKRLRVSSFHVTFYHKFDPF
jgi:hypothetical protein